MLLFRRFVNSAPPLPTLCLVTAALAALSGCTKTGEVSKQKARAEVELLSRAASVDVEEVRAGLPLGAKQLENFFADEKAQGDAAAAKEALDAARGRVQDRAWPAIPNAKDA